MLKISSRVNNSASNEEDLNKDGIALESTQQEELKVAQLIKFFLPLQITSLIMMISHSFFNAGLARLSKPEVYISAFAVSRSLIELTQSPVIMIRQTFTSLVDNSKSYKLIRKFSMSLFAFVIILASSIAFTPLSRIIFRDMMGVSGEVLEVSIKMLRVLAIFPFFIGLRSFGQGISLKFRLTPMVTLSTITRIAFVLIFVTNITKITLIPDDIKGAVMFLGAVGVEAIVVFMGSKLTVGKIHEEIDTLKTFNAPKNQFGKLTLKTLLMFFIPLVLTTLIQSLVPPTVNTGLARTVNADINISTHAVAWSVIMVLYSPTASFHQVPINFLQKKEDLRIILKYAISLMVLITAVVVIVAFTPVGFYILNNWIGTSEHISRMARDVLKAFSLYPTIVIAKEFCWGYLMKNRLTKLCSYGTTINVCTVAVTVFVLSLINLPNPAILGAIAMTAGVLGESIFLLNRTIKYIKSDTN